MLDIKFGTETVVYSVIEIEGKESLGVDSVYEQLLRLRDKVEEKKEEKYSRKYLNRHETGWLLEMGAFVHNEDGTLSRGENFDKVKAALKEKKTVAFWDDLADE